MPRCRSRRLRCSCVAALLFAGCARGTVGDALDASLVARDGAASSSAEGGGLDTAPPIVDGDDMTSAGDDTPSGGDDGSGPPPSGGSDDAGTNVTRDPPVENGSRCKPGTYVGTFRGNISAFFVVNIPISGELTIVGLSSSGGDYLTIDNGKIDGQDQDGNPVTADVIGTMNCATYKLEGGALRNGVYVRKAIDQTVSFEGTVQATYQPTDPPTVTGTWSTASGVESGAGTFDATLRP